MIDIAWEGQSCCGQHRYAAVTLKDGRRGQVQETESGYCLMVFDGELLDTSFGEGGVMRRMTDDDVAKTFSELGIT